MERTGKSPAVIILEGKETYRYFSVERTGKSPVIMVPVPVGKNTYFTVEMTGKSLVVMTPEGNIPTFRWGGPARVPRLLY